MLFVVYCSLCIVCDLLFGGRCSLSFAVRRSLFIGLVCSSLFVVCLIVVWCVMFFVWCVLFAVRRVRLLFAGFVGCTLFVVCCASYVLFSLFLRWRFVLAFVVLCWRMCDVCRCLLSFF